MTIKDDGVGPFVERVSTIILVPRNHPETGGVSSLDCAIDCKEIFFTTPELAQRDLSFLTLFLRSSPYPLSSSMFHP